jgi:hypothetical protein
MGADLRHELIGRLVSLSDVDLVDAVSREDLAVDEDIACLAPGRHDVFLDPVRVLVERERIVGAPPEVSGRDPDVVGHPEILDGSAAWE